MSETNVSEQAMAYTFDLTGGCLCLNFTNTVDDRMDAQPKEHLLSYQDLLNWGLQTQVLNDEEARYLSKEAQQKPEAAVAVLQDAIELREIIYRILVAIAEEGDPEDADLALFNRALAKAMARTRLVRQGEHFSWDWIEQEDALDRMLWAVVRSVADVLTSDERQMVRVCAAEDCSWLFLDTSKNRSRRWCNMKSCGNRAKVRKHHERQKLATHSTGGKVGSER